MLGGIEDNTHKGAWRYHAADKAAYLAQIAAWGYTLSKVEQLVIDGAAAKAATRAEAGIADEEDEFDDFAEDNDSED